MTEKQKQKLYEKIKSDPYWFIKNILEIKIITDDQKKIIDSVRDNKLTAVKSGHNLGKTFIEACLAIWYLFVYRDSIVITTAPTARQVKDILWNEINNIIKNLRFDIGGYGKQYGYIMDTKWFATGISTSAGNEEESAVNFQGYHAKNIFIIIDEAIGLHPAVWEAIDGVTSNEEAKILAVGNPSTPICEFKKRIDQGGWNVLCMNGLNHPNVINRCEIIPGAISYKWVKEKIRIWTKTPPGLPEGEERKNPALFQFENNWYKANNLFLWKVLGEFPEDSSEALVSYKRIKEAEKRYEDIKMPMPDDDVYMGIDVARYGNDASVIAVQIQNHIMHFDFHGLNTTDLATEAVKLIACYGPKRIGVDCDGIGGGVYDVIQQYIANLDIELYEIHGNAEPVAMNDNIRYANLRAQMYWKLREDINSLALEPADELEEGFSSIRYFYNVNGELQIESKIDFKKRLGRSSDIEDAVVYVNFMKYVDCGAYSAHDELGDESRYTTATERMGV